MAKKTDQGLQARRLSYLDRSYPERDMDGVSHLSAASFLCFVKENYMGTIYWLVGLVISSFTVLSSLICLIFGIPVTKKLERAGMLQTNHPITSRYIRFILISLFVYAVILGIVYFLGSIMAVIMYLIGTLTSLLFGIGKIGRNKNNLEDYINTQSSYFSKPIEDIINYLNYEK